MLGNKVFLAAADTKRDAQIVLCFDRQTGQIVWEQMVHHGGLNHKGNKKQNSKASLASSTIATNGHLLFINFLNDGAVWTSALSLKGDMVWQKKICPYIVHQGYGSSPAIFRDLVIVSADNKGGGAVVALKQTTGQEVWRRDRPKEPNYPSPILLTAAGKEQLLLTGCNLITSLAPATGAPLWEVDGATTECVTSTVTDGKHVFTSGGYPKNHISCVAADGSGKVVWEIGLRAYVPSMLIKDGHLYAVLDAGVATCVRCDTGEEVWKKRLGGTFTSSPVLVGDTIYVTNEDGETFLFRARPDKYEGLGRNQLAGTVFATPAICGDQIYLRVAQETDGERNEFLYCLGRQGR